MLKIIYVLDHISRRYDIVFTSLHKPKISLGKPGADLFPSTICECECTLCESFQKGKLNLLNGAQMRERSFQVSSSP